MTDEAFFSTIRHLKQMIREQNRKIDDLQKKYNDIVLSNCMDEIFLNMKLEDIYGKLKELEELKNGKEKGNS